MMRIRVKICGVTTPQAIRAAVEYGADAIGFVFAESPRRVTVDEARALAREVPPFTARVAVFRHPAPQEIQHVVDSFHPDIVQTEPDPAVERVVPDGVAWLPVLHDHEFLEQDAERYVKRLNGRAGAVLLEAPGRGGRGIAPDWKRAAELAVRIPLVLAGGLTPTNVGEAVRHVRPYAVDVSSGVESSPGIKDVQRIAEFLNAVRRAEQQIRSIREVMT